jgi:hypothetical protein
VTSHRRDATAPGPEAGTRLQVGVAASCPRRDATARGPQARGVAASWMNNAAAKPPLGAELQSARPRVNSVAEAWPEDPR